MLDEELQRHVQGILWMLLLYGELGIYLDCYVCEGNYLDTMGLCGVRVLDCDRHACAENFMATVEITYVAV